MPKLQYEYKSFNPKTTLVIGQAEDIIHTYQAQGFTLTLRQLYYQFVARGLLENTTRSYKRLGSIVSDARRAGLIDWYAIEDRTRFLRKLNAWDSPQSILESAKTSYHRRLWEDQPNRVEVWIEKDALVGVIEAVCQELDVPFFSCRGYVSDSEMWVASQRILSHENSGIPQDTTILHLGDHDPSGIDMTRDISDRLHLFRANVKVNRIALTMEQIEDQGPPPNPAKVTDSRYESYAAQYGEDSWELDALEPQFIAKLISEHVLALRDEELWDAAVAQQEEERGQIEDVIERWDDIF